MPGGRKRKFKSKTNRKHHRSYAKRKAVRKLPLSANVSQSYLRKSLLKFKT